MAGGTGERLFAELSEGLEFGHWKILAACGEPGELCGIVACQQADTLPLGPHLFVRFLYVLPAYRKTRCAHHLLVALADFLMRAGLGDWLVVGQSTGLLRRSYRKLGFLPLSQAGASKVSLVAEKLGVR